MSADLIPVERLTSTGARELTDKIRSTLHTGHKLLLAAHTGAAHVALGYGRTAAGWAAYCEAEFSDARMLRIDPATRAELAAPMREAGMSYRAIGSALGVSPPTLRRDLAATGPHGPVAGPAVVTSLDGRTRPASRPAPAPAPEVDREAVLAAAVDDSALRLARWRRMFAQAMSRCGDALTFAPSDIRERADAELLSAYAGLVTDFQQHLAQVTDGPRLRTITPSEDR